MWAALTALIPLFVEILRLFSGSGSSEREKIKAEITQSLARIRQALQKAEETGGDTSDIEDIINGRK